MTFLPSNVTKVIFQTWFFIPLVAAIVGLCMWGVSDRIFTFFYNKSLGQREEVIRLMDLMFVKVERSKVTIMMLLMSFGFGALVFILAWPQLLVGLILGIAVTIGGWALPKLLVQAMYERRCNLFVNQMVDGLTMMANGVKAGVGLQDSMSRMSKNLKAPLSQEFDLVLAEIKLGRTLEQALSKLGERIPRADVQMFVTSINILNETGGNMSETFETIVSTIRERQKVEQKISALTAQGLMQGIIISLVPFILALVFFAIDPGYLAPMFNTGLGLALLGLVLILEIIGGLVIKKVVTIKV